MRLFPQTHIFRSLKPLFALGVLAMSLGIVSLRGVSAVTWAVAAPADPAPDAPKFGSIDFSRVVSTSKVRQQAATEFQKLQQNIAATMKRLDQGSSRFLSAAEINELAGLYQKDKPTEAEQKRISDLEAKGDNLRRDMTTLQNTPAPTDAQTAKLTALSEQQTQGDNALKALDQVMMTRLREKADTATKDANAQIQAAVAKVAKAKGLSVVFVSDAALYVTIDVTDDVIKELNK